MFDSIILLVISLLLNLIDDSKESKETAGKSSSGVLCGKCSIHENFSYRTNYVLDSASSLQIRYTTIEHCSLNHASGIFFLSVLNTQTVSLFKFRLSLKIYLQALFRFFFCIRKTLFFWDGQRRTCCDAKRSNRILSAKTLCPLQR